MAKDYVYSVRAARYRDGIVEHVDEPVVGETLITLHYNGKRYATVVATADSMEELGAGFFISAGITDRIDSVKVEDYNIYVTGPAEHEVSPVLESAGGFSAISEFPKKPVESPVVITPDEIFELREALNSDTWADTGGLHCTALSFRHRIVAVFSDIGRHNTVDKAVGYMILNHLSPAECIIACTGRQPYGMVEKAANAGIPIIVSRAAATIAGIELADIIGITLICFTRDRRFTVYTHTERVDFNK